MKTLCVIPARGGSKAIPKKNLYLIAGKPLIGFVIESVLKANAFDRVILSTDSTEIATIVKTFYPSIEIPFIRPEKLATDDISVTAVIKHAVDFFENENYDIVYSLQPTNPFTRPETLIEIVKMMEDTDCDSLVTITKILHYHPFRTYRYNLTDHEISPLNEYSTEKYLQKQDRPDAYGLTGGVLGRKTSLIKNWSGQGFALGTDQRGYVVSEEEAFDLDTPFEMELLEGLISFRKGLR